MIFNYNSKAVDFCHIFVLHSAVKSEIIPVMEKLAADTDPDVKYFATEALSEARALVK